jgi:hypothetical protein
MAVESQELPGSIIGMILHQINTHSAFAVPMGIVADFINKPPIGATLLLHATITWMKHIAYIHANGDYRLSTSSQAGIDSHAATALVKTLIRQTEHGLYPQNVILRNMFLLVCTDFDVSNGFSKSPRIRIWKIVGVNMCECNNWARWLYLRSLRRKLSDQRSWSRISGATEHMMKHIG